ncbi:MAG TPA: hydrogenase expression/formation protein HypE [Cyanobacteria bacterium UBA11149]|nr:hydrogenase expression/formation protein HypE [Cyanobacteria bacterium UBA11367]HBE56395.1 hydrogenase expression/formation protein HypE [Cyanobacteria bacterium UBA11366]HBK63171.1 hydrogenase expression/formation protein HypE [Cyanobacteria bacterium UBA11166]HBR76352.1 hydrogenase expression/formation protein HypE [Cyanobacteria bacterium UBA11159]HBS71548.1 hydrogenase expression/formation protein HypE [Cyanobacteria bacterium UBA11153]HBW88817.1 hydrogenase expression/formation protein
MTNNLNPLLQNIEKIRRRPGKIRDKIITLAHGSGGKAMRDLIDDIFVTNFDNPILSQLEDQASFPLATLTARGDRLAFTTDSYVVDPLFFPGSDIGALAVNGTINDLAVSGAKPLYLTCSLIIEEGLEVDILRQVIQSMKTAAESAGIEIITGDTKVVNRGCADKLFINTAGIGVIPQGISISAHNIQPGDIIIINGEIGNHGTAILIARGELALETEIKSDCQPLHSLVDTILNICPEVHAMRDATRGGLATVLNEFALTSNVGMRLDEESIPIAEEVKGVCEILGLDPLYLANEGKLVVVVPKSHSEAVLSAMKSHPAGANSAIIGEVMASPPGVVLLQTAFGTERIVDMLVGDQLPRIC